VIPARKRRWFRAWFAGRVRAMLTGRFEAVRVCGLERLRAAVRAGPVLVVCNHVSWWDPLVALFVTELVVPCDSYALMDAANLRRLPFFALIGGFGVDLTSPSDGAASMRYAVKLLKNPGALVWVFPQGRERPPTVRPLEFRPGSAEIARLAKAVTVPVALRYEFAERERPYLYVHVGEPIAVERDVARALETHEKRVLEGLGDIDTSLRAGDLARYETVIAHPPDRLGALAERALAWLTRPLALKE
jgi:1-acyl-sn-glycerol-3-phosphate acyltransferase